MGKKLIIKDADFSENAVDTRDWISMQLYQPSVFTNPEHAKFGQSVTAVNTVRNKDTITLPNGKEIIVRILNNSGVAQSFAGNSVSYNSSFEGALPSEWTCESFTYGGTQAEYHTIQRYPNNLGHTLNVVISIGVEGISDTISPSNYQMYYVIEDI